MQPQPTKAPTLLALLLAGLAAATLACSSDDDGPGSSLQGIPTSEAASDAGDDTDRTGELPPTNGEPNDRDDFINTTLAQIEQIEVQLAEVEAHVEATDDGGAVDAQARIDAIKTALAGAQAGLVEVPTLSDSDYQALQARLEAAIAAAMTETQELAEEVGI
jgi:hypothetical protein